MNQYELEQLRELSILAQGDFYIYHPEEDKAKLLRAEASYALTPDDPFFYRLEEAAGNREVFLLCELDSILFVGQRISSDSWLVMGPFIFDPLTPKVRQRFAALHNLDETRLMAFSLKDTNTLIALIQLAYRITRRTALPERDILRLTRVMNQQTAVAISVSKELDNEEEERIHHSYRDEMIFLNFLREGKKEEALAWSDSLRLITGQLSTSSFNHWIKLAVVGITLFTRTAISAGVSVPLAYKVSDIYMNALDSAHTAMDASLLSRRALLEFLDLIQKAQKQRKYSSLVNQCKFYLESHLTEPLSLEKLSDYTGANPAYLSGRFSQVEKMTLTDYLNKLRIERAQTLLRFSDRSMTKVYTYLGYNSQSYFAKMFKRWTGLTPSAYRAQYSVKEGAAD